MATRKDIEFDAYDQKHIAAWTEAENVGREKAAELFSSSNIEAEWGYNTSVPVEFTYEKDGVKATISKDIDISEYDSPEGLLGSPEDMDDDITDELREEWIDTYVEEYAEEHWTEYLEDEETPEEKAYKEISAKWDELDKSKTMLWDVITNVVECKELRSIPRESKILIQSAYELITTARDCIASELRKVEEERAEAERVLKEAQQKAAEPQQEESTGEEVKTE